MSSATLAVWRDLRRVFGSGSTEVVALTEATGEILEGDRVALTGPSGSGKSTLLQLIAGLDTPTSGSLTWPALGNRASLRPGPVGVVFQAPSLLPPLNVLENVALPLLLQGEAQTAADAAALDALRALDLDDLAAKLPEELSGGQAQRVAVARILASRPRLILADEPTGQLDHDTGAHVIDVLLAASDASGAALVINTHDPAIAQRFATQWIMRDGHLTVPETAHKNQILTSRPAIAGTPC